jgi:hypothetical protein
MPRPLTEWIASRLRRLTAATPQDRLAHLATGQHTPERAHTKLHIATYDVIRRVASGVVAHDDFHVQPGTC